MAGMQRMDITPDQIESTAQRFATTRVDPLVIAGWKLMVLVSVGLVVLLAGLGYAVYLLMFTARARLGTLQTMGLTRGQLIGLLGIEHIAIVVVGLGLGSWAGFQMSRIMISSLAVTETGDPVIPPFVLNTQWSLMAPAYVALGALILLALYIVHRAVSSVRLNEVSRMEV